MPDELADLAEQVLQRQVAALLEGHRLRQEQRKLARSRKAALPTKPFSVNMFKEFASDELEVKGSGRSFFINNSWRVGCQEMVGIAPCKTKRWNGHIWFGDKLALSGSPGTKTFGLFSVITGTPGGRPEIRYVVSDGLVWADVYKSLEAAPWVARRGYWGLPTVKEDGWRLVDRERKRPLTQTAQRVIRAAFINFGGEKPIGNLLEE